MIRVSIYLVLLLSVAPLQAEIIVKKNVFEMTDFVTFSGANIPQVKVGWESYGKLNQDKSNVILITHYFTGTSHAAGKYHKDDPQPGYWNSIIGPGKAIDTNKYFVLSVDTLVNLNVHDANVITTGPASIDPTTNKPYGLTFPVVTIRDFVNVQKALLEEMGVEALYAVIGPSMGSLQAIDWAAAYPDWVPRLISVIGSAQADAWTVSALERWAIPIRLDKNWLQGGYSQMQPPIDGLIASLMFITQDALHPDYFNQLGTSQSVGFSSLEMLPLNDIRQSHSIVNWLRSQATARASNMDANHLLYLVRANQLFIAGHGNDLRSGLKNIKARSLFLPAEKDGLLRPYLAEQAHETLLELNKSSHLELITGNKGHLEGVVGIEKKAHRIATFLTQ